MNVMKWNKRRLAVRMVASAPLDELQFKLALAELLARIDLQRTPAINVDGKDIYIEEIKVS